MCTIGTVDTDVVFYTDEAWFPLSGYANSLTAATAQRKSKLHP